PLKEAKTPPLVDYFIPLAGMDRVFALNGTGSKIGTERKLGSHFLRKPAMKTKLAAKLTRF
ncbi:MAG: hypothetical protein RQ724_10445, partial [Desulfuromonadales bacterium]|nr:hypothetical protein [Desulfuromonadales bacterium]